MLRGSGSGLNRRQERLISLVRPGARGLQGQGDRVEPEWRDRQEREFALRNDGGKLGDFPDL